MMSKCLAFTCCVPLDDGTRCSTQIRSDRIPLMKYNGDVIVRPTCAEHFQLCEDYMSTRTQSLTAAGKALEKAFNATSQATVKLANKCLDELFSVMQAKHMAKIKEEERALMKSMYATTQEDDMHVEGSAITDKHMTEDIKMFILDQFEVLKHDIRGQFETMKKEVIGAIKAPASDDIKEVGSRKRLRVENVTEPPKLTLSGALNAAKNFMLAPAPAATEDEE